MNQPRKSAPNAPNRPQPILSAPKDGSKILLWDGEDWVMGFWDHDSWYGDHHSARRGTCLGGRTITHWMPQPPSPNTAVRQPGNE